MGEKEKKSGEAGERVAKNFLRLIGWKNLIDGIDITCFNPEKHQISEGPRKKHGLDFFTMYSCPLFTKYVNRVPVSMKYRKKYKSRPTNELKKFIKDIDDAAGCIKLSSISNVRGFNRSEKKLTECIIWLAYEEDPKANIIKEIDDFRTPEDTNYETVILIDNFRINFILGCLNFLKLNFPEKTYNYYYTRTSFNLEIDKRISEGPILPVEYLASNILLIKMVDRDSKNPTLVIFSAEPFDEDDFKKFIGIANTISDNWPTKILICFPDYHELSHEQSINIVKSQFEDKDFADKISALKFDFGDFRALEVEKVDY
ncbi:MULTISPECIES: GapS4a family protein [unclassified Bacillus (in: firmicutes)]